MLTKEMKRQVFMKLRTENYRASLRLEGMMADPAVAIEPVAPAGTVTAATPKIKHGR